MTARDRAVPAGTGPRPRRASCLHCGTALDAAEQRFCCHGCEGAYGIVRGLGLDAFYRQRESAAADGSLKPGIEPPQTAFSPLARHDPAKGETSLELMVSGLQCGACIWLVEQALAAEPDVLRARASLSARRLSVTWRGPAGRADQLVLLLARLGFRVAPWSPACLRATEDAEGRALLRALGVAAFGSMNVMLASVAVWAGSDMGEQTRALMHWLAAIVALPVIAYAGMPFYRSAWRGLVAGRVTMDFAISFGVLATTAMSVSETLRNGPYTWFDSATALLALLLGGRVLERLARRRARQSMAELLALQTGTVLLLLPDGTTAPIAVERVEPGSRLLVASGERIRLDGIAEVETLLDTASTTGESVPRLLPALTPLPAGAVNMGATFAMRVTHAASDGSLAAMARLLERAEAVRGRFVSLADRGARLYVPFAHAAALATFLGWWLGVGVAWQEALVPAVAALIITCPCGLAIAVPAVQVVAIGALFRRGVLVASPTALERLATADHVVFDKTGTLSTGRPVLDREAADFDPAILAAAASLARASRHPLARALAEACPSAPFVAGVEELAGRGLRCRLERLGSAAFCRVADPADGTHSVLWYRASPDAVAIPFRFTDRLRLDAAPAVRTLAELGLTVELLSGDHPGAVEQAATRSGIAQWTAQASPTDKAQRIEALNAAGRRPLMVGDGLNDAAALSLAHVSATPANATDLAQVASDFVLQPDTGLAVLPVAILVARKAQRLARQNIALSLGYNLIAVPCAMLGLASPLIAALVMASSSLVVILNALRAEGVPAS